MNITIKKGEKMKTKRSLIQLYLFIAILLIALPTIAQTQQDTLSYNIETTDGNSYQGKIIEQDDVEIIFQTNNIGNITIQQADIKKIQAISNLKKKDGKYWLENPQSTRYFFSPNGFGLKAKEGYYQNVWVMVNSFAVGVTDYISVGGGVVPLFLFAGFTTPIWLTAKASIPVSKKGLSLGVGALGGTFVGEEDMGFGILYGITTIGNKNNNVSIGLGYGYAGGSWAKYPMVNVNFMFRTGPKGNIISENYYINNGETFILFSIGGRTIVKNSAGIDYGLWIPFYGNMDSFVAIPWLGVSIPFGTKKKNKIK